MSKSLPPREMQWPPGTVFTIGHSRRSIVEFIDLLQAYDIQCVVDIRSVPRSRHNPQFNADALAESLAQVGIDYQPLTALGGLRHPRRDSGNTGWHNAGFRGYADYMQTPAFAQAVEVLLQLRTQARTAIMCAEAVPWRCHRSLVADALLVRGVDVIHILSPSSYRRHSLTSFAKVDGLQLSYPPPPEPPS